jgi:hypothetical protein
MGTTRRALSYTNRAGDTYYLHRGKTKTGKARYFAAKTVRDGAVAEMPAGYEFSESINGVVSVRRVRPGTSSIPDADLALVRAELARHPHLRHHRVEVVQDELVVFEPRGALAPDVLPGLGRMFGLTPDQLAARLGHQKRTKYDPVMKFEPAEGPGTYIVRRMTYRGEGGWSHPLAHGPLRRLVRTHLKHVGTEGLYELA